MNISLLIPMAASAAVHLGETLVDVLQGSESFLPHFAAPKTATEEQAPVSGTVGEIKAALSREISNLLHTRRVSSDGPVDLSLDQNSQVSVSGGIGAQTFRFAVDADSNVSRLFTQLRHALGQTVTNSFRVQVSDEGVTAEGNL